MNVNEIEKDVFALCTACCKEFRNNSVRKIRRTADKTRKACIGCSVGMGWEYKYTDTKGGW
jgi:hypothetical protein